MGRGGGGTRTPACSTCGKTLPRGAPTRVGLAALQAGWGEAGSWVGEPLTHGGLTTRGPLCLVAAPHACPGWGIPRLLGPGKGVLAASLGLPLVSAHKGREGSHARLSSGRAEVRVPAGPTRVLARAGEGSSARAGVPGGPTRAGSGRGRVPGGPTRARAREGGVPRAAFAASATRVPTPGGIVTSPAPAPTLRPSRPAPRGAPRSHWPGRGTPHPFCSRGSAARWSRARAAPRAAAPRVELPHRSATRARRRSSSAGPRARGEQRLGVPQPSPAQPGAAARPPAGRRMSEPGPAAARPPG